MKKHLTIWLLLLCCVFLPLSIFAVVRWNHQQEASLPVIGGADHIIADYSLVDQSGAKAGRSQWNGRIVVASFFFTHCPVVCPKMTKHLSAVRSLFSEEELRIVSFTVDTERDNVQQLQSYAAKHGIQQNGWQLLTGDKQQIYQLARESFQVTATKGDGGPDDFIHSDKLVLVDGQLKIRGYYTGTDPLSIKQLMSDIKKLQHEH